MFFEYMSFLLHHNCLWVRSSPPVGFRLSQFLHSFMFFKCLFILRESMCARVGEGQREGDRGSKAGSALTAESPMWGLNS